MSAEIAIDEFDEALLNKKCGASGTADENKCHVGEAPSPTESPEEMKRIGEENAYLAQDNVFDDDVPHWKADVVDELSERSGISRGDVNQMLAVWAETSNDHDPTAMLIQATAEKLFNAKRSDWQKAPDRQFAMSRQREADCADLLRAMHEYTQESLDEFGIKEVTLYRGIETPEMVGAGETVKLDSNAIESWTSNRETAEGFAADAGNNGIVVRATFPAAQVLSSARTGLGCLHEHEFTILNNGQNKAMVTIGNKT